MAVVELGEIKNELLAVRDHLGERITDLSKWIHLGVHKTKLRTLNQVLAHWMRVCDEMRQVWSPPLPQPFPPLPPQYPHQSPPLGLVTSVCPTVLWGALMGDVVSDAPLGLLLGTRV